MPTILEAFPKIILPADALAELFEGRSRIRRGQKTRLRKAVEIRDAIAKGQLKVLRTPSLAQDPLSAEIGVELSALIREAKASNGIVVRPAPVHRIGLADGAEADMQPHADNLCDMHGILRALVDLNAIDEEREKIAAQYFELQDRGWPSSASPSKERPIFLDGLALTYLQHTRLLPAFLRAFPTAYIHVSTEDEASALIEDDQNVSEIFRVIDDIRSALRQANATGHVVFGSRRADGTNDFEGVQSSLNLLADLSGAEVVVIDDRALNKELFAVDALGHRARVASTLDLLEELLSRGLLTEDRYRALRFRLRASGTLLVPVTSAELLAAAKRNRQNEAPEFRAVRDSLDLARVSEMPQFPGEMRWFMCYVRAIRVAVTQAWVDESEKQRARILASAIFDMRILPEDWVGRWGGSPPPGWIDAVRSAFVGGFMVPVEIADEEKVDAYQKWLDDVLIFDVQSLSPELYKKVVEYIRKFVLAPWGEDMKMTRPDLTPQELARIRVRFALHRMRQELQSDVLADGAIAKQAGITLSSPINLPEDVVLERKALFSAFQRVADGESISEVMDIDGVKRDITIEIQNDMALATYGSHRIAFPQAALLSENLRRRQQILAAILKNNTLTSEAREKLQSLVAKPNYSHDDFFAARDILVGAPESFATTLREVAGKGTISKNDLLPTKTSHWENLIAKRRTSEALTEFIKHELAEERAACIVQNPKDAVDVISLTFGGPELVPLEAMRAINPDDLHAGLTKLLQFPDPLALAGAFEICADMALTDARFVELGNAVLDRLLGEPQRLRSELTTFAAAFVITTAYLAEHETLRKEPVFWRRLAAASHASLVMRVLGGGADDESSLFTFAMQLSGKTYYLSVLDDSHSESRWRPDWISQNYLIADVYGRLQGATQKLGEAVPATWRKKLEDTQSSVLKDAPPLAQTFPSVLQGWMPSAEKPPGDTDVGQMYEDFAREPTVEKFLYFTPLVFAFGFARDAHNAVLKVVQLLRANLATTPPELAQAVLDLAALIAAQNRDPELADTISVVAVERLVLTQNADRLLPTVAVIMQCAAARTNRSEALSILARRFENLAFVAPAALLSEALDAFRILQSINEELGVLLGRSIATARLGIPRVVVV